MNTERKTQVKDPDNSMTVRAVNKSTGEKLDLNLDEYVLVPGFRRLPLIGKFHGLAQKAIAEAVLKKANYTLLDSQPPPETASDQLVEQTQNQEL